ncbi:MAG: phage tail tube protein [Bryobacteraceae bacterium]
MAYISSNNNRFYVALEGTYGQAAAVAPQNRIPAVKLAVKHRPEKIQRKDKTGTRTFLGDPSPLRNTTTFTLTTYMANWFDQTREPGYGALFQACMGGAAMLSPGGRVASPGDPSTIAFASAHGLVPGQAVSVGDEIRFVTAVVNDNTVQVNVPFTSPIPADATTGFTATYKPASELSSATIYDRWDPAGAVQRLISGAAINDLVVKVNGDFHEFEFSGDASDLIDSVSFENGQAGLSAFPDEPTVGPLNYSIIPGHLGQVWLGSQPSEFLTLTKAQLHFNNDLDLRAHEFGSTLPRAIAPGIRDVTLDFSLYQQNDAATQALYQAARQRSPISVMLQLGQRPGELFGIYMKSVVPEVPEFDDAERRQQWQFQNCRAQGGLDDEIFVAFG